jgi:16S rRNA (guanine966-N2)-methyltransferase
VPDLPGLRPTPDRVRETLFNWLQADLPGSRCLDLFAGTGALGLEAASRGAAAVLLVDRSPRAVAHLRSLVSTLGDDGRVRVLESEGLVFLESIRERFDVVFLDPPFGAGLVGPACDLLQRCGVVSPGGCVYVESELDPPALGLPGPWLVHRSGRAGAVRYYLVRPEREPGAVA